MKMKNGFNDMDKIIVKDYLKTHNCYDRDQGDLLFNRILSSLKQNHKVELDFLGIEVITSAFLSSAFSDLLYCHSAVSIVKDRIKVINMDKFSKLILNKVMKHKMETLIKDNPCTHCIYQDCPKHP